MRESVSNAEPFGEQAEDAWDRQIADDVAAGKLDAFVEEALADFRAGRTREL